MANILVVDDSESIRDVLSHFLTRNGHHIAQAASGEEAIASMQEDIFDIAIIDIRMDGVSGLDLLKIVKDISPDTEIITITGYATVDTAVEAMKLGAYDFVTKPVSIEELLLIMNRALGKREFTDSVKAIKTQVKEKHRFTNIIGNTPAMLRVSALIERVCHVDSAVLVTGESGTGKELVARTIHTNSRRRHRPFVPVNCAALPEDIQESELFGHAKGAFTDAISSKKGLFEEAHSGTVFLDEIADASSATQAKLLRFLENGEIRRVGENTPVYVDVRLIAATSKDISEAVKEKAFREDLYYRINVIRIHLPPLRERKDDISHLAHHFMRKYARHTGKNIHHISQEVLSLLMEYDWPGNVRELQNAIQHAVAFTRDDAIFPSSLPSHVRTGGDEILPQSPRERMSLYELKRAYTLQMLEKYSWNCAKAAAALGIGRATIYRKLKEYGFTLPPRSF